MAKGDKTSSPGGGGRAAGAILPKLARGFVDRSAADIRGTDAMIRTIREVYERYGFEPVETPLIEYSDVIGKFLPDQDRPNEGVFSFQDDDESWLSLRYDLTAPLARYVAQNYEHLPKPYRSYRAGWVFRNEKPGPGRFRQFMQFDADTVGAASPAADAEMCMMAADTLEALGIPRGQYVIKVNSRKVLDGVMESVGLSGEDKSGQRLTVLRAIDKFDRLGWEGVEALLGKGRLDESGDFTKGAGLGAEQIQGLFIFFALGSATGMRTEDKIIGDRAVRPVGDFATVPEVPEGDGEFLNVDASPARAFDNLAVIEAWTEVLDDNSAGMAALGELRTVVEMAEAAGYGSQRIQLSSSVVRGLEYYTGPVFEAELLFETVNEKGEPARFGSVGGGGRYDGLVGRFRGENVPATGFSIGVSRLMAALSALGKVKSEASLGPVVVLVLDRDRIGDYQRLTTSLRNAGIAAELYLGESGMKAQMKYADRRNAPCVVIQGSDERASGTVQLKDLALGKALSAEVTDNTAWREGRPAQFSVAEGEMVAAVRELLARQGGGS